MHILILKRINVKLGWFLTTRATTALLGPATESRRAVVRFGSRSLAIRKHLQQDVLRIHLHLNCRQWYLELLRYRSFPVASFPPYRWEESRALKDNESYTQIWEEYNGVPDDNNNRSARCKLGGSDSLRQVISLCRHSWSIKKRQFVSRLAYMWQLRHPATSP